MHRLRYGTSTLLSLAAIVSVVACAGGSPPTTGAPSDVAFGDVLVGTSASRTVEITNDGDVPMTIVDVTATGAGVAATGPALPLTVAAGASASLAVRFAPETSGDVQGAVLLRSDLGAEPLTVATYTGKGVLPSSDLAVSPAAVDFGDVSVGASASRSVTLTNGGSKSVSITTVTSSSAAVTTSGLALPVTLAPGASRTFQMVFRPAAAGAAAGHVALRSEPSRPLAVIEFGGNGTSPAPALSASPPQVDFQDVPLGEFSTKTVTLTNDSAQAVTISGVTATGAGVSPSGLSPPAVVAPGASTIMTVRFTPTALGPVSGTVSVLAPGGAALASVSCAGRGVAAPSITTVTVRNASVDASRSVQLVADVVATGTIDTSVTWGVESGSLGTVDATSGLYKAPAIAGTHRVRATSKADPSKQGVGVVTVVAAPPPPPPPTGVVPAFPGAEGGGSLAKGGRGGAVIKVTNLNDSGPGSLRACVQASGPRTCVFTVGGTIQLASTIVVSNPYLTVAGQTAPGGGIQLSGKNLTSNVVTVTTHNVVWRYTRLRKGFNAATATQKGAPVFIWNGSHDVIFDHNSISWAQDENITVWGTSPAWALTFSWNLVAEPLAAHPTSIITGGTGAADGMVDVDFHHNLVSNSGHRNPLLKNRSSRWVSNIVYNWGFYATQVDGGVHADVINNRYVAGPLYPAAPYDHEIQVYPGSAAEYASGPPALYVTGNMGPRNADPEADNWSTMVRQISGENGREIGLLSTQYRRTAPLPVAGVAITADPARSLEAVLLPSVGASQRLDCSGAWVAARDGTDARLVSEYHARIGRKPTSESEVGGFPALAAGAACLDTDGDGMPDMWETARGLDPSDPADRNRVDASGYTRLEDYLNGR